MIKCFRYMELNYIEQFHLFLIFIMATRKLKITYAAHIIFLLDSAVLKTDFMIKAPATRDGNHSRPGRQTSARHFFPPGCEVLATRAQSCLLRENHTPVQAVVPQLPDEQGPHSTYRPWSMGTAALSPASSSSFITAANIPVLKRLRGP